MSLVQLVMDAWSMSDFTAITGNWVKFGLSFVSLFFDVSKMKKKDEYALQQVHTYLLIVVNSLSDSFLSPTLYPVSRDTTSR